MAEPVSVVAADTELRARARDRALSTFIAQLSEQEVEAMVDAVISRDAPASPPSPVDAAGGSRPLPAGAPRLIGLSGMPRSGKDLAGEHIRTVYAGVRRLAFSDVIIAEANAYLEPFGTRIGEHNKSHPPYRLLLQTVSVVRRRESETYWSGRVGAAVRAAWSEGTQLVIATGVRAPSDVALIRELGGQVWRVRRPGHESIADLHPIEQMLSGWEDDRFDRVLVNGVEGDLSAYLNDAESALGACCA